MSVNKNGQVTTPDHMVDHDWQIGVPRLSYPYNWVSKGVIFHKEQVGGGADGGTDDQSWPRGRPQVVSRST